MKQLVEKVPNLHWVDLSSALDGFVGMSAYAGKSTYFDGHNSSVYGATMFGELFMEPRRIIFAQ